MVLLALALCLAVTSPAAAIVTAPEKAALVDLWNATRGGSTWLAGDQWLISTDPCVNASSWPGVLCGNATATVV